MIWVYKVIQSEKAWGNQVCLVKPTVPRKVATFEGKLTKEQAENEKWCREYIINNYLLTLENPEGGIYQLAAHIEKIPFNGIRTCPITKPKNLRFFKITKEDIGKFKYQRG